MGEGLLDKRKIFNEGCKRRHILISDLRNPLNRFRCCRDGGIIQISLEWGFPNTHILTSRALLSVPSICRHKYPTTIANKIRADIRLTAFNLIISVTLNSFCVPETKFVTVKGRFGPGIDGFQSAYS